MRQATLGFLGQRIGINDQVHPQVIQKSFQYVLAPVGVSLGNCRQIVPSAVVRC